MASLLKLSKIPAQIRGNNCVYMYNVVRNMSLNRDYAPGPYPLTEAERAKAAAKYGLPLADYKPIPDDGHGHGDYPDLPLVAAEIKDPYYPYDNPELKRNFNEPMHIAFNLLTEDKWCATEKLRYPVYVYWLTFLGVMTTLIGLGFLAQGYKCVQPVARKQMPNTGGAHYTFESLNR